MKKRKRTGPKLDYYELVSPKIEDPNEKKLHTKLQFHNGIEAWVSTEKTLNSLQALTVSEKNIKNLPYDPQKTYLHIKLPITLNKTERGKCLRKICDYFALIKLGFNLDELYKLRRQTIQRWEIEEGVKEYPASQKAFKRLKKDLEAIESTAPEYNLKNVQIRADWGATTHIKNTFKKRNKWILKRYRELKFKGLRTFAALDVICDELEQKPEFKLWKKERLEQDWVLKIIRSQK